MSKSNVTQYLKIRIEEVVISDITRKLYDYANRDSEIESLKESIALIGQQQPITVIKDGQFYVIIDGVLRYEAVKRLNLNEIDALLNDDIIDNEFSLSDLIIHNQIHKDKTIQEKLNEIRSILRLDQDDANPLRDKEKRVSLVSSMLGKKGWARNNVFSLEKILRWELGTGSDLNLAKQVISYEIPVKRALDTIELIQNPLYNAEKEEESHIVGGFLKGSFPVQKAKDLMNSYDAKKSQGHTVIDLYPVDKRNFTILQGNIEEIELPEDLLIDTIFSSPPYYRIVKYGDDPNELGWEDTPQLYVKRLADILMKCYDKLKPTGSMFINLGESYGDNCCYGVTERLTTEMMDRGVNFVDRLIWNKTSNKPVPNRIKRLVPGYETILHFSKTKNYYFERIRIQSDKSLKVSRGCKEKGKDTVTYHIQNNYDQFRNVLVDESVSNVLTVQLSRNRTKHIEGESIHPATFSSNLPVIPLLMSTPKNRDSVVFDPFLGSGSCGVTALLLGFTFVGVELYSKNIATAERILSESQQAFNQEALNSLMDECYSNDEAIPESIDKAA